MSTTAPPLAADLNEGLRRLKMAAMRRLAPERCRTGPAVAEQAGARRRAPGPRASARTPRA